jgi:hypothetical protein
LLWFWSPCIKNCHILCCGLHVILYIFQPGTACLDLSQCPDLSILSHNSFPEGALIWKLASPVYQVWNSIFWQQPCVYKLMVFLFVLPTSKTSLESRLL